ncbi:AprI/Inh family metalloprotease inhibitor [Mesorhizobium sp. BR1-1-16]|uniref:AprI/Inh family metalloprotease inhibitor n=1 Tax=Mesorhizobium sp. BR1-1-16 TaxID=2876653 RepID=UPI001CCF87DA|nr:AprI/Inh family metalloprotease inhibitor [Mesorhizobium sp. BR1-1-16]MBZ9937154.1 AprI/Inh family metalloprotease inhibitor [Mesorhizobium sp. BR1-1-16]
MRLSRLAPIMLTAALAGCGSFGAVGLGPMDQPRPVDNDTLPPVASAPVEKSALPPPPVDPNAQTLPPSPPSSATLPPADAASLPATTAPQGAPGATVARAELGRTDLLGGWSLRSGSESCQLFMTLTSWTGGYRASTRGCQSPTLKGISAWSLNGSQVVLAGAGGAPVAHLNAAGTNSFAGTADSGQPIAFSR